MLFSIDLYSEISFLPESISAYLIKMSHFVLRMSNSTVINSLRFWALVCDLGYVHFLDAVCREHFPSSEIFYFVIVKARLPAVISKLAFSIDASIW